MSHPKDVPGRFQHRAERAFPGLLPPHYEKRVREILSNPHRSRGWGEKTDKPAPTTNALRYARCAHVLESGRECKRVVRPITRRGTRKYDYLGMGCFDTRTPHRTYVPPVLDDHVLEIVQSVFTVKRLEVLLKHLRTTSEAYGERARQLNAELAQVRRSVNATSDEILEARAQLREAKQPRERETKQKLLTHWRDKMEHLQGRQNALQNQLTVLQLREREFGDARDEDLEKITKLAVSLPLLLERARQVPGMLSRVLYEVIHLVRVRRLGQGVYEVRVQFQEGLGEVKRVFWHGNIRYPQPAALYAYERLRVGDAASDIADDLRKVFAYASHRAQWTTLRVEGAAAFHELFSAASVRKGVHQSITALAERTQVEAAVVTAAMLEGRLGPAKWENGGPAVCPTDVELHEAFPSYARLEIGRLYDVDPEDLIETSVLYSADNGTEPQIAYMLRKRLDRWIDASGRRYILRSAALQEGLKVEPIRGPRGSWRDAVERELAAIGDSDLRIEDFISIPDALKVLSPRFPFVRKQRVEDAIKFGHMIAVSVPGTPELGKFFKRGRRYIHLPEEVVTTADADVVRRWLWKDGQPPQRAVGAL